MIEVLFFADRAVKQKLFERVSAPPKPLLVTAVRHAPTMRPAGEREPFASLERDFGELLDQLLLADEGDVEGMWRDPMGDLADALFPHDRRQAYAAACGYLLLGQGAVLAVVGKRSLEDDRVRLQQALADVDVRVPPPSVRPKKKAEPPPSPKPLPKDPYALLGIARDASPHAAKKAFHALIAQYHPDKVSHLAPEFRELAELRTRQILAAWEEICSELGLC
ncbi:MAG: J domain-containing protein [Myxococcota bacterium]